MERLPYYSVPADVAKAIGSLNTTYRTKDGRFILSEKSMRLVLNNYQGQTAEQLGAIEITASEAQTLIKKGGYKMGEKK